MARRSGLSNSTIGRIWRDFGLNPHRTDTFKLSSGPSLVEKAVDIVGVYHRPPEKAVVLCTEEKSQIQVLDRSQPVLPMMPGMPERRPHDYARHGITTLSAAFDTADGTAIGELHPQHRAAGPPPPLPHAFHPDRLLDQPGRTATGDCHAPFCRSPEVRILRPPDTRDGCVGSGLSRNRTTAVGYPNVGPRSTAERGTPVEPPTGTATPLSADRQRGTS